MRLSIKTKQVAGVTSIVGLAVVVLSGFYLASLARIRLEESRARGKLLADAIYHRAREVVAKGGARSQRRAARRRRAALDSRVERVFRQRDLRGDRRCRQHRDRAQRHGARRTTASALRRSQRAARSRPGVADPRDLHRRRTDARNPGTSADGNRRVRLDSHRRVDAARAARPDAIVEARRPHRRAHPDRGEPGVDPAGAVVAPSDSRHP